MTALTKQEYL
ncbi:uncharacterized protein FFMR_07862 [Fusarium fujikuroi]|nr:uncharacterized protein FFMR_07862 [Fusarium fujikuroi]